VLFGLPLRQTTGFVESLLELVGLDWAVPDFSTLCRRQKALPVAIPYRGSAGPLHLLVDSTGIKAEGATVARNAHAVIPPRKNAKLWKPPFRACRHALSGSGHARCQSAKRSGLVLKVFGPHIVAATDRIPPPKPRRNNPLMVCRQTTAGRWMHCVKLLGQHLMARDFDRQVAEIQIRFADLNRYTALGIPVTEPVG
jgi:Transposase DDE domain